jgi:hypothetical protein
MYSLSLSLYVPLAALVTALLMCIHCTKVCTSSSAVIAPVEFCDFRCNSFVFLGVTLASLVNERFSAGQFGKLFWCWEYSPVDVTHEPYAVHELLHGQGG